LETALAADIRIAATDVRMSFPEIRYGLSSGAGDDRHRWRAAGDHAGRAAPHQMDAHDRPVDASRALQWGLVDEIVNPDSLDGTAELAAEMARHPASALAVIKQTVDGLWDGLLRAGLRAELVSQVALFGSEEYAAARRERSKKP
jgi:enoyl-CoA hydratase/carnithine racemase